jgi:hypothetical protein
LHEKNASAERSRVAVSCFTISSVRREDFCVLLSNVLAQRPVATIDAAIAVMTDIEQTLPATDGLWWFNHLYLRVTVAVLQAVAQQHEFRDPEFLHRLDVVFANLYFDAAAAGDTKAGTAPPAWRPLLEARTPINRHPLQYALAGMNAHINRDLPAGIVAVYQQLGGAPTARGNRFDDFQQVNGILESVESAVKVEFATGLIGKIDAVAAPVDDQVAMWNVRAARDAAWTNAEVLWTLQSAPALRQDYFDRLDRFTGFASRGLLVPVSPLRA